MKNPSRGLEDRKGPRRFDAPSHPSRPKRRISAVGIGHGLLSGILLIVTSSAAQPFAHSPSLALSSTMSAAPSLELSSPAASASSTEAVLPGRVLLSAPEEAWLRAHPVIRLGVSDGFAPFNFPGPDGSIQGIAVDYLRLFVERTGARVEIDTIAPWATLLALVENGAIDGVLCGARTSAREKVLTFTTEYCVAPWVLVTRAEEPQFNLRLNNLGNRSICVLVGSPNYARLVADSSVHVIGVQTVEEIWQSVASGRADVGLSNLVAAEHYIASDALENLKISGILEEQLRMGLAVRKDWPEFAGILNKAIASITPAEAEAIRVRWLTRSYHSSDRVLWSRVRRWFVMIGSLFAAFMTAALIWNLRLKREIVQRKQAQEELRAMEQRAARAERQAAISRLGGGVAHEMNNVLCGIRLAVQRGLFDLDENPPGPVPAAGLRESLEMVEHYTTQGARIVASMKAMAMPQERRQPEPFLVEKIIDRVLQGRASELRAHGVRIEKSCDPGAWVLGNPDEIEQVILNLVINADHALIPGGGGVLRLSARVEGGKTVIRVEDSGIGMAEDVLKRIFQPFFSTKGAYATDDHRIPGTGLGLAICSRIVEEHGGTIEATSVPGEGSVFVVTLPAAPGGKVPASAGAGQVPQDASEKPEGRRLHILVVDDEEMMARELRDFIARRHPEAHYVTSGRAALDYVAKRRPDVIFTDFIMPDMRADAMLRQMPPGITVVLITGWIDFEDEEDRRRTFGGFHRVLMKPYDLTEVSEILREVGSRT